MKISIGKVGLVVHYCKSLFKTNILIFKKKPAIISKGDAVYDLEKPLSEITPFLRKYAEIFTKKTTKRIFNLMDWFILWL